MFFQDFSWRINLIFVFATKMGEKTFDILNWYFSKWIAFSYIKLSLLLINSIYWSFFIETQKRLVHTKLHPLQTFLVCLKRSNSQTFKCSRCKKRFIQCVWYWLNLLWWILFILWDNWKTSFHKSLSVFWDFFQPPCCCFLWNKCFERSPCFRLYSQ